MREVWKPYPKEPFSNYFSVSNKGRVKSNSYKVERGGPRNRYTYTKPATILKLRVNALTGHYFCALIIVIDGEKHQVTCYPHKTVAELFVDNPDKKDIVIHRDGDYSNNRSENLMWVDQSYLSKKIMQDYPHLRLRLRDYNVKTGYYEKLRKS